MSSRISAVLLALALAACGAEPTSPSLSAPRGPALERIQRGTGLVLESLTGLPVVGDVVIQQVVITELALNAVGGLEATGTITAVVDALGTTVSEDFTTEVDVSSSSGGKCDVLTVDLAPVELDLLSGVAEVDLPAAEVAARGSGPLGALLCMLGQILEGLAPLAALEGVLNAINNLL